MNLRIVGCPEKEKFLPYLKKAVDFYSECLFSKKLCDNIHLKIKFNKTLEFYGNASIEEYNNSRKAREFLIQLNPNIGAAEILKTLAHEMVHVKQFAAGELNDTLTRWKGSKIDSDELDYYSHPWEIEAEGMETGLFTNFVKKEKLWEIFEDIRNPDDKIKKKPLGWKI